MNTQRRTLNFFKEIDRTNTVELECEDFDTDAESRNTDKTN